MQNFIFDLYGTLVDIRTDEKSQKFKKQFNAYFKKINPQKDFFTEYYALCNSLSNDGGETCEIDLSSVFAEICGQEKSADAARRFRKFSTEYLKLYGGVRAFLKKLKAKGKKLFILSNAQSCFTLDELKKLKILKYFDGVEISSDFGRKKPDACFFENLISKYALKKEDSIFVGNDICSDLRGAQAASLRSAYVLSNLSPESDSLEEAKKIASFVCDSHKKLFENILSL